MSRFCDFDDNELYMLKRQAIEASYNIVMENKYSAQEIKMHNKLLNEIVSECGKRERELQISEDYKSHY